MQPFIPASKEKQEIFARKMAGGDEYRDFGGARRGDYTLQQPTMIDREAESRETGLESLFNAAFSVSNKPEEVRQSQVQPEKEGFLPGIESSPPDFQNLLPTKPKRQLVGRVHDGEKVEGVVPSVSVLGYLLLALVVMAVAMVVRQGWGQWSEVGSFIWKVLNGSGTEMPSVGEELGGVNHLAVDELGR